MNAARSFGRFDAVILAGSKLRKVWLSVIAVMVSAVLSLPSALAAPGDVDALNLNIVGSQVLASAVQPDGKTIIAGAFSSVLGQARNNIARLNADGTLDAGFDPNANNLIYSIAVQADGQILLGGEFTTVGGSPRNYIARVAANGTLDAGFDPNANNQVFSIAVQTDGQILLGGIFTNIDGSTRNRIARVAANGTVDAGFSPNVDSAVRSIAVQADGQILLGGQFTTVDATSRPRIARVAANGTLDAGFAANVANEVYTIAVQADGQILLGGLFGSVSGTTRSGIARLAANGAVDPAFDPDAGGSVNRIAVQADGQILLGGAFTTVGGTPRNNIARVAANGTLDAGFNPNADNQILSIALQANGQILLGGQFTTVGGSTRNVFARLLNNPATQSLNAVNSTQVLWTRGGSAPDVSQVAFELSTNGGVSYTPLGGTATRVGSTANWQLSGLSLPASGQLRARGRTSGSSSSGLVEQVTSFSFLPADITSNLQASYACDGNTLDSTANARHLATDYGVANFTPNARSGIACSFNGATRLKSISPFAFSWPVTYSFWINDVAPTSQKILMQAATFGTTSTVQNVISLETASILRAWGNNPTFPFSYREVSPSGVVDSTWHHVAITGTQFRDTIQIYIDGTLASTATTGSDANFDLDGTFFLGSRSDFTSTDPGNYAGKLDEIRLYDRVLAPADITELAAPPGMSKPADVAINEDTSANNLPFTVNDLQTPAAALTVTSNSSNTTLLPNANVVLGGSGANRTVSLTPNPNASGTSTITLTVTDGNSRTDTQRFVLTVNPVNDAPSFVAGANQSVFENVGVVSVPGWASAIDDGDPESVQTLNFVVTPLAGTVSFSVFPTVSSTGTLSYTTTPDSNGIASFSVRLDDNGGTANGGVNQSGLQNFTVSVGAVNSAPTFAVGTNQNVLEDVGAISVPAWASAIDDGDPELVQAVNFTVTPVSGTVNFSVFPTVSPTGTLSYTTAPDSVGSATFSVQLNDSGGTANGGINQSVPQNFTVSVGPVNDAPSFVVGANQLTFEDAGASTLPGWATAIDDGDPEVVQTLSFEITAISATVGFSAGPTIGPDGTLSFTPAPNQDGSATFTFRLNDDGGVANGGANQSPTQNFTISVIPVNDPPTFVVGANQNVLEDASAVSVPAWATAINDGDGGVVQSVNFTVTPIAGTVNFSVFPSVTPTGTLSYTLAPNSAGSATFSVRADDNGGTANGGVSQSTPQNFSINVAPINDAPTFVVGANQNVLEDAGPVSVPGWASAIDDGDPESVQTLIFSVISNSNPGLFSAAPSVDASGTLSYSTVANASGTASISLRLDDNGGTVNGGINQSAVQNFTITVAQVNDAPSFVAGTDQVLPPASTAPQSIANWASAISDGDPDFLQTLSFNVSSDRSSMFSVQPAVSPTGTLSFTPNGTAGLAIVSVSLSDDASAGGAALTTPVQTFNIIVRGTPIVSIEQRTPAATVVGQPFDVRVRVRNPTSTYQPSGTLTVTPLPVGASVQCTLSAIATPAGSAEALCSNLVSPIASAKLILANYSGDAVFLASEGNDFHPVEKSATRLTIVSDTPDPSISNSPVEVRYLLEVLPPSLSPLSSVSGTIAISDGQTEVFAPFSPSNPIITIALQGNGPRVLTARFGADSNFLDSSDTENHELIGGNSTDLAVEISNGRSYIASAGEAIYQVRVRNLGTVSSNAQLDAFVPAGLDNYRWSCSASAGSSCHAANGVGAIVAGINVQAGGVVSYTVRADVTAAEGTSVSNSVRITPSLSPPDGNSLNDTAVDTDVVAVYLDGFED